MKILFIGWHPVPFMSGGANQYLDEIMQRFQNKGHEIYFFFTGRYDLKFRPYLKRWELNGITMLELTNSPNLAPKQYGNPLQECSEPKIEEIYSKALLTIKPELVHIHELAGCCASIISITVNHKIPTLLTLHNCWPVCPQGTLFNSKQELCTNYNLGQECLNCASRPFLNFYIKTIRRLNHFPIPWELIKKSYPFITKLLKTAKINRPAVNEKTTNQNAENYLYRRQYFINALNHADRIIAVSQGLKNLYIKMGVIPEKIISLSPVSIVPQSITSPPYRPGTSLCFGYMGGLAPHKGLHILLKAFAGLDQTKAKLLIYGNCTSTLYSEELKNLAKGLNVEFRGAYNKKKLGEVLQEIQIGVVPSICYEAYGLVIKEFFAAKIPVLASDIGGMPEQIANGVNGLIFKANSSADLRTKMEQIIADPSILMEWRKNIVPPPEIEPHLKKLLSVYSTIL